MDPFYAFLIFVLLIVLDLFAAQTWLAPYYRFGIPVYFKRVTPRASVPPADLIPALEGKFKASPINPTLRFRPVGGGALAMRESLFESRGGLRYLPIQHLALFHPADGSHYTLVGFLNWYVLGTIAYVVYRTTTDSTYGVVAILVAVIFLVSFASQLGIANRVGKEIANLPE